jgi:ribosome biogenesis GTPase A
MIKHTFKANRPKITWDTNITPYWKVIEKIVDESDVVLEILDARMPELSRNDQLESLINRKEKKLIFILNKSDLTSEKILRKKFRDLNKINQTFIVSSKKKIGTKRLRNYILKLSKEKERLKIGIVGYPNTGKSSVINSLVLMKKAQVTSKAGTTHGQQWINLKNKVQIIDSPGIIPVKQDDEVRLALIGSKNVEKLKEVEIVAQTIINLFLNKDRLNNFYKINLKSDNPEEFIEEIGRTKGFISKGNKIDFSRTCIQIIRDWQSGKLRLN